MVNIKFIIGSTRPGRFGPTPAKWLMELAAEHTDATFELMDLAEVNLPLFDEPQSPMQRSYKSEHAKRWAAGIDQTDGFVLITPEYNHSMSAALKNALDYAFWEWRHKPVGLVGYGAHAGGARAVEHLRQITGYQGMYDLNEHLIIPNYWEQVTKEGFRPTKQQTKEANDLLDQVVFWAEKMKAARAELAQKQ